MTNLKTTYPPRDRLPTPQAMDAMGSRGEPAIHKLMMGQRKGRTKLNSLKDVARYGLYYQPQLLNRGEISPNFVEWMMGFPCDWTNLKNKE